MTMKSTQRNSSADDNSVRRGLRRGELAQRSGSHIETIRFYEKEGILPSPQRTLAGHRIYGQADVERLLFIRRCRELGFTLDQVRTLLALSAGKEGSCAEVHKQALAHRQEVTQKIADLRKIERVLGDLASQCALAQEKDDGAPSCPIVEVLSAEQGGGWLARKA